MITFRKLTGNINVKKELSSQSSLEQWFERVIDIPIDELTIGDLCRAIRQELFVKQLMPVAFNFLKEDPLAGENYDGELITALSTMKDKDIKDHKVIFIDIIEIINRISVAEIDYNLSMAMLRLRRTVLS